jgi:hypothetical protein
MTTTQTAGQAFTTAVRSYLKVGTRTRQTQALRARLFEMIRDENEFPGYYGDTLGAALRGATQMTHSWDKHVEGYRIDPTFRRHIELMSMWQFTAFLGRLIDETSNVGEAEMWFSNEARTVRVAA